MGLLLDLTTIFAIAAVVLYLSSRAKVPTIVGLLVSGFIAGPYGFKLVSGASEVEMLAEIGILLLLFTIGMEFSLEKLLKSKGWILAGGGAQVALTTLFVFVISFVFDMSWQQSLFAGFLFSLSSTAIVLHLLQEKGQMDSKYGNAALSILIFQDVVIIPLMLIVPYLAPDGVEGSGQGLLDLAKGVGLVALIIWLARTLVPRMLRSIVHTRNQELFLVSILVICFATAFVTYELGLKLALGAFLAGLIVSESEFSYDALSNMLPLKKIFTSIFFISIGMLLNASFFVHNLPVVFGLTIFVMFIKLAVLIGIALMFRLSIRNALLLGLSLCQVGEFAFVLADAGQDYMILTEAQNQTFLAVSICSMAVSPFIMSAAPRIATWVIMRPVVRHFVVNTSLTLVGQHTHGCTDRNHLVIIGFGLNGQNIANQAKERGVVYSVIELNEKVATRYSNEGEPVWAGDARKEEILISAAVHKAKTIVIAVHDVSVAEAITIAVRKLNHNAYIIVRSQFASEVETFMKLGANEVIPERVEAARRISERTMLQFAT